MLDVAEGDVLVLCGAEYPIRSCEAWPWLTLSRIMIFGTERADIKRSPSMAGGKRGVPALHLTGVRSTPLLPATAEILQRQDLQTPHTLMQVYLDGGDTVYALVVEDLKR